jgi:hypothetical protein
MHDSPAHQRPLAGGDPGLGEVGHDLAQPLRTDGRGDVHRMNDVREQHRDLLVLGAFRRRRHRRTTLQTELRVLRQLDATR